MPLSCGKMPSSLGFCLQTLRNIFQELGNKWGWWPPSLNLSLLAFDFVQNFISNLNSNFIELGWILSLQLVKGCQVQILPMNYWKVQIELEKWYTFEIIGFKPIKVMIWRKWTIIKLKWRRKMEVFQNIGWNWWVSAKTDGKKIANGPSKTPQTLCFFGCIMVSDAVDCQGAYYPSGSLHCAMTPSFAVFLLLQASWFARRQASLLQAPGSWVPQLCDWHAWAHAFPILPFDRKSLHKWLLSVCLRLVLGTWACGSYHDSCSQLTKQYNIQLWKKPTVMQ